MQGLSGL